MRQLFEICDAGTELSCAKTREFSNMRRDAFSWQPDTTGTLSVSKAICHKPILTLMLLIPVKQRFHYLLSIIFISLRIFCNSAYVQPYARTIFILPSLFFLRSLFSSQPCFALTYSFTLFSLSLSSNFLSSQPFYISLFLCLSSSHMSLESNYHRSYDFMEPFLRSITLSHISDQASIYVPTWIRRESRRKKVWQCRGNVIQKSWGLTSPLFQWDFKALTHSVKQSRHQVTLWRATDSLNIYIFRGVSKHLCLLYFSEMQSTRRKMRALSSCIVLYST